MAAMVEIPEDKDTFKIGEVAKLLELEPYVLRYWETEFEQLSPDKTRSGQRVYTQEDVALLSFIQHLLHVEMYTIAGARRQLELRAQGHGEARAALDAAQDEQAQAEQAQAQQALEALGQEREALLAHVAQLELEREALRQLAQERELRAQEADQERELLARQNAELEQELASQEREIEQLGERLQVTLSQERSQREREESAEARWELLHEQLVASEQRLEDELLQARQQAQEALAARDALRDEREALQLLIAQLTQERDALLGDRAQLEALRAQRLETQQQSDQRQRLLVQALRQELRQLGGLFEGAA